MKRIILSLFLLLLVPSAIATAKEVCSFSPTAKITTTPVSGSSPDFVFRDGTEVVFSGATSTANNCNGSITEYRWKIEGVYYYGSTKTYTFPALGASEHRKTYSVELRVRNDASPNLYNTKTITVTVKRPQRIYHLKDHLGNVRTSVDTEGNVVGYDDYYPFGLVMDGRSNNTANPNDNYKFTGHERDGEAGLTIDYMMARGYDPVLGRFMQIDPHSASYPSLSPYAYVANNPLMFIDPTGEYIVHSGSNYYGNYFTLSRYKVSAVRRLEMLNGVAGWFPGGSMIRSSIRGTRDPSYSNTNFGIATDIAGAASPLARKGLKLTTGLNYFNAGSQTVGTAMSAYEDFTPEEVGFDEVLFNTLTTIDYGNEKLFVDNGSTVMGSQISVRSDIANSGSVEDVGKLASSFVDATSALLKGIANGLGVDFSSKSGRQKVMNEIKRNREIYEYAINILASGNLKRANEE